MNPNEISSPRVACFVVAVAATAIAFGGWSVVTSAKLASESRDPREVAPLAIAIPAITGGVGRANASDASNSRLPAVHCESSESPAPGSPPQGRSV